MRAALLVAALCAIQLGACGNQDHVVRARVEEAAATGRQAAQAVGNYMRKHGRAPAQIEEAYIRPAELRDIKLMSVNRQTGHVRVALAFPPVEGKSLLFVPTRSPNKTIVWRCTSEDIQAQYLPEACR
ncbi:MAG TPA: pilin [Burkholderiales bacterium]